MSYEPDEQDSLIEDAEAIGGAAFVDELHFLATAEADRVCPWNGVGSEPHEWAAAWLDAARRLVDERRAALRTRTVAAVQHPQRPASFVQGNTLCHRCDGDGDLLRHRQAITSWGEPLHGHEMTVCPHCHGGAWLPGMVAPL